MTKLKLAFRNFCEHAKILARVNFPREFRSDFGVGLKKKLQALRIVMAFEDN
jgi:hypothetical protein